MNKMLTFCRKYLSNKFTSVVDVSFLWVGSLIGSGSTFLIYTILARKLGPTEYGIFSSSLSIVTIFNLLAGFGLSQFWLKIFGEEGWQGVRWLSVSLKFLFVTFVLVAVLLFSWAYLGPHENKTRSILLVMIFFVFGQTIVELVSVKLQLEEKYLMLTLWQLSPNLFRLILVAVMTYLFFFSLSGVDVANIYAFVAVFFIIVGVYQLYRMSHTKFDLKGHLKQETEQQHHKEPKMKEVVAHVWAFGLGGLFSFLYLQSDQILVKYLAGNEEAGYYSVAFVILTAITMFPNVLYQKFLIPKFHRWANYDRRKFYRVYRLSNYVLLFVGILIMIFIWSVSKFLVPLLFGDNYKKTIDLVNILAIVVPILFVTFNIASTLVTQEYMKKKVRYMGGIAILNILLNTFLIPLYGSMGAAISTVCSNFLLLIIYYYAAEKIVFKNEAKHEKWCL